MAHTGSVTTAMAAFLVYYLLSLTVLGVRYLRPARVAVGRPAEMV